MSNEQVTNNNNSSLLFRCCSRCFITGDKIADDESIDHVIPWSYLYSDDLWSLVLVKKGANSSKSNNIPEEDLIKKLEQTMTLLRPLKLSINS